MTKTKSKPVTIARKRPYPYPLTPQQINFREILKKCDIRKGMSRSELVDKMQNCIPEEWRKLKEAGNEPPLV